MVDQQELQYRFLRAYRHVAVRMHHHALRNQCGARRHWLGSLLDFDQAHAATGRYRQLLVVAEVRNVRAIVIGSLQHRTAFGHHDLLAVYFDFNHLTSLDYT